MDKQVLVLTICLVVISIASNTGEPSFLSFINISNKYGVRTRTDSVENNDNQ